MIKKTYDKSQGIMGHYLWFKWLTLRVEIAMVFQSTFHSLRGKLNAALMNNERLREVWDVLDKAYRKILNEWHDLHENYPEAQTAFQTRHAIQVLLHHKAHDLATLFNEGVIGMLFMNESSAYT